MHEDLKIIKSKGVKVLRVMSTLSINIFCSNLNLVEVGESRLKKISIFVNCLQFDTVSPNFVQAAFGYKN